ncbi:probable inactive poly [ADP-ribose] polymerase SRO5 isoform X2 [Chenopodium quinoa]|uniref:probable inactive poly [ADP-ribose] polymerase SRO5 isoform X2 n=1 Tax=Chenopodium quinoa TaxID=63459 RepID=UPI000B781A52|nr:probable inactive poly [ADP-ribose] polymerase SRO5 isoform X2 [Chenopodium quinoa]
MEEIQFNGGVFAENYDDEQLSDCESCVSGESNDESNDSIERSLFGDDLVKVNEDVAIFDIIGHKFLSTLVDYDHEKKSSTTIAAIHTMNWKNSRIKQARFRSFDIFREALVGINNNNNYEDGSVTSFMKYAWYCDSKEEIQRIVSNGFGHHHFRNRAGICLAPLNSLAQSVQNCIVDDDGLKHALLCRVLLENVGDESDDDVDGVSQKEYLVWSNKMNTHILPEYVVSFTTVLCLEGIPKDEHIWKKSESSLWMPFSTLISVMSNFLPSRTMVMIIEHHKDFKERKISRQDFIKTLKRCVGNDFLIRILKYCGAKE